MGCSAAIDNFLWNVRIIPTRIELEFKTRKAVRDPEYLKKKKEKQEAKEQKKQDKEVMKMAEEAANQDRNELYSDSVRDSIVEITKDDESPARRIKLINRACDTNKLIQFATFYMTDDRGQLMNHKQIEKEIINGIAALFEFGKIYEDAGVSSLVMYDFECKDDYLTTSKYLLSIEDIMSRKKDPVFMEKLTKRKQHLNGVEENVTKEEQKKSSWVTDENGIVHPIFIAKEPIILNEDIGPVQGYGISDELFNRLESEFSEILTMKHRYEINGDLITLFVYKNGIEEFFTIDPGIIMGLGRFGIIAKIQGNDEIIVPLECKDIVKNIITNSFYVLTAEEIQTVLGYYFSNMNIYRYIDMSFTEKITGLSKDDMGILENKLSFIISKMREVSPQAELPRLRFNHWSSVNDFMLISDPNVKSPLAYKGDTSPVICEGLLFQIDGNNIIQRFNNNVIAEYNLG